MKKPALGTQMTPSTGMKAALVMTAFETKLE
jgi:hypothetical protein